MVTQSQTPTGRAGPPGFPAYHTSFIGRDRERDAILRAFDSSRLVTLAGPGGVGKTRLAVETALSWLDVTPAEGLFTDLSRVTDGTNVAEAVMGSGLTGGGPGGGPLETLVALLSQGRTLLVLDNCEHVVEASAQLASGLRERCPDLRILATSRIPLGVAGEALLPVAPLARAEDAKALFMERARLANALFEPSPGDDVAVAGICDGLDRLPLGIELAAASTRWLSIAQIRERLVAALDTFTASDRDVDPRHRTLRATVAWSYDLLGEGERLLFPRLAVFSGGWRLESAEGICSGEGIERRDVARLHAALVEQGLIAFEPETGRYRLLEPIREFAAELLPAESEWQERHAAGFAALTERLAGDFHSPPRAAQARLREEDDNLLKAVEWSYASARLESGLRIVAASARHWRVRGATHWLGAATRLTNHPDARGYGELWAVAWLRTVSLEFFGTGLDFEVIASLRQIADTLTGSQYQTEAWIELGLRLATVGQTDEAIRLLERGHQQAEEREDPALRMHALHGLSEFAVRTGDSHSQWRYAEEMVGLARKIDNPFLTGLALGRLGMAYGAMGNTVEAESMLREALAIVQQWDPRATGAADIGAPLARLLLVQGRHAEAAEILRPTLVWALNGGNMPRLLPLLLGGLGIAAGLSGAAGVGTRLLTASLAEARRCGLLVDDVLLAQLGQGLRMLERAAGPTVFREETARGEALSVMEAVELALNTDVSSDPPPPTRLPGGLTAREAEVLRLVAAGNTNREIANRLVLSLRTVETHIFNVYSKTNTGGRAAATGWAIANGIYEPTT